MGVELAAGWIAGAAESVSNGVSETASAAKTSVNAEGWEAVDAAEIAGYEAATNDMKILHAANAHAGTRLAATWLTGASSGPLHYLGRVVVTPFVTVVGIGYEVYTGFAPFDKQPFLDWIWDTPGDLVANTYGQFVSLTVPDAWARSALRAVQVIPGPNHALGAGTNSVMNWPGGPNGLP